MKISKIFRNPYFVVLLVYVIIIAVITGLYDALPILIKWSVFQEDSFYSSLITNMYSNVIDLIAITYLLYWIEKRIEKNARIRHLKDNIDDTRYWFSDEAAYRNRSNIRKLQEMGITELELSKSALFKQIMKELNLKNSRLMGSMIYESNIEKSKFYECNFQGSNMHNVIARNTFFQKCNFRYVNFSDSNLQNVNINESILIQAKFDNANLKASKLKNCDFKDASFLNTNMERADLRGARNLTKEQLFLSQSIKYAYLDESFLEDEEIVQKLKRIPPKSNT